MNRIPVGCGARSHSVELAVHHTPRLILSLRCVADFYFQVRSFSSFAAAGEMFLVPASQCLTDRTDTNNALARACWLQPLRLRVARISAGVIWVIFALILFGPSSDLQAF